MARGVKSEKKSSLDFACELIVEHLGTCPRDMLDWEQPHGGCDKQCGKLLDVDVQCTHCWKIYFIQQEYKSKQV